VDEFEFIDHIKSKYSLDGLGDDCAVLPKDGQTDQLITADMLVEEIDFRLEWATPEFLGHKSLAVSLSDIAAMGGGPKWSMLSVAVPPNLWNSGFLDRFYEGYMALAREFSVQLVGGDISRSPDKVVIDSTVGGEVSKGKAILRSGAQPGDGIFVTGTLGGAAGGLRLLENGSRWSENLDENTRNLLLKQLKPTPYVTIGKLLRSLDILTSMIDISDGLSSDLRHLCEMSRAGAEIGVEKLPINPFLIEHFPADECLEMALNGGEDLELLFTADEKKISDAKLAGIKQIGKITESSAGIELKGSGQVRQLPPNGYRHF
jgi:thiamine-monophosphate kinase